MESQFNFLKVKEGKSYFARVAIVSDPSIEGVQISPRAGIQNPLAPEGWMEAAQLGAEKAQHAHVELGGTRIGLTVTCVVGTDVDTSSNTVEVASYCAAWKALGHSETELIIEYDLKWRVRRQR